MCRSETANCSLWLVPGVRCSRRQFSGVGHLTGRKMSEGANVPDSTIECIVTGGWRDYGGRHAVCHPRIISISIVIIAQRPQPRRGQMAAPASRHVRRTLSDRAVDGRLESSKRLLPLTDSICRHYSQRNSCSPRAVMSRTALTRIVFRWLSGHGQSLRWIFLIHVYS